MMSTVVYACVLLSLFLTFPFQFGRVVDGFHIKLQVWDTAGQER